MSIRYWLILVALWAAVIALVAFEPRTAEAAPSAFPGAVGFAKLNRHAFTGGNPTITKVTNLNASGSGSFAACYTGTGNRLCLCEVSGVVTANAEIKRGGDNMAFYGETCPAPGLVLYGATLNHLTGGNDADNVLVKHLTLLVGDHSYSVVPSSRDAVSVQTATGVYYDHITAMFSMDEIFSAKGGSSGTIANSLFAWPLRLSPTNPHDEGAHNFGIMLGNTSATADRALAWTMYRNVETHAAERTPRLRCTNCEVINNVIYNSEGGSGDWSTTGDSGGTGVMNIDYRGNYFKCGPNSTCNTGYPIHTNGISTSSDYCVDNNIHTNHAGTQGRRTTNTGSEWLVVSTSLAEGTYSATCAATGGTGKSGTITPIDVDDNYENILDVRNVGMRPADMEGGLYVSTYALQKAALDTTFDGTGDWIDTPSEAGTVPPVVPANSRTLTTTAACGAESATCLGSDTPFAVISGGDYDGYTVIESWIYRFHTTAVEPQSAGGGDPGGGGPTPTATATATNTATPSHTATATHTPTATATAVSGNFPAVVSTSDGEVLIDAAVHAMNIVGLGTITAGNRLTCFGAVDCTAADSECVTLSVTVGTGWTLAQNNNANWNNVGFYASKIATADANDLLTLTSAGTSPNQQSTHICVQTSGTGAINGTSFPSSGSGNFNAASHTCAGGSANNLFWVLRAGDNTVQLPSCPTGYADLLTKTATNAAGASTGICRDEIAGATSDPDTVVMTTEQWVAWTVCMEPAVAPTPAPTHTPTATHTSTATNTPTPTNTAVPPTATPIPIVDLAKKKARRTHRLGGIANW